MGKEIERKFLIRGDQWRGEKGTLYRQGYLNTDKHRTVRIRTSGDAAHLTIKGITEGATRREYEYEIPIDEANELLTKDYRKPYILPQVG